MNLEFRKCLERRSLVKAEADKGIISSEIKTAEYDLERAVKSLEQGDFKWAAVQAYYCIFHSSKALVYIKGYKERSHYCLLVAFKYLYCDSGEMDPSLSEIFENAMNLREEADYEMKFSEEAAEAVVINARKFLEAGKSVLKCR